MNRLGPQRAIVDANHAAPCSVVWLETIGEYESDDLMADLRKTSKFLSYVLRHCPEEIGIELGDGGWVEVDTLLNQAAQHGKSISRELLDRVVRENDKQRFAISEDGRRIRANQGHSVDVDLGLEPRTPPNTLHHGTVERFLAPIAADGLDRGARRHVHLSRDRETAESVGQRRGAPIILRIDAAAMHAAGHEFYLSENGVWLTDHVPPQYIEFPK
ncbi:MAG: RNA 2'-phosphotransferase [Pirellulaceae bacterium]|nr:RNA 2'-phosphotransferase [Pirellulaceae bacterium]MDP7018308.1 RNA 2'-phosphotransferase [Pirellulaceae bacterium]